MAFFKKAKEKIWYERKFGSDLPALSNHRVKFDKGDSVSQSIWDNSLERYQKNDFKLYWELLREVRKYQYKYMTGGGDARKSN
jgi:hypothetical protein